MSIKYYVETEGYDKISCISRQAQEGTHDSEVRDTSISGHAKSADCTPAVGRRSCFKKKCISAVAPVGKCRPHQAGREIRSKVGVGMDADSRRLGYPMGDYREGQEVLRGVYISKPQERTTD